VVITQLITPPGGNQGQSVRLASPPSGRAAPAGDGGGVQPTDRPTAAQAWKPPMTLVALYRPRSWRAVQIGAGYAASGAGSGAWGRRARERKQSEAELDAIIGQARTDPAAPGGVLAMFTAVDGNVSIPWDLAARAGCPVGCAGRKGNGPCAIATAATSAGARALWPIAPRLLMRPSRRLAVKHYLQSPDSSRFPRLSVAC